MTFRARSDRDVKLIQRRKKKLKILEYVIHGFIFVIFIFLCMMSADEDSVVWNAVFLVFIAAIDLQITTVTFASIFHIHRHSKSIESIGVKTNSLLMKIYAVCWTCMNLFYLAHMIIGIKIVPIFTAAIEG